MRKLNFKRCIIVYGLLCSSNLYALELDYLYGYRTLHSDNIRQSQANEESENINQLYAGISLNAENSFVESNTRIYTRYDNYIKNTYEDNFLGDLDSLNSIIISPTLLTWKIDDHYHYLPIDISQTATPANNQQTNLFSTGPVVTLNASSVDKLVLEGRYNKYQEEITDGDNHSAYYAARLNHAFSINSSVELDYEIREYTYDNPVTYSNYTRHDAFVKYISKGNINDIYGELGNTDYKRDDNTGGEGIRSRVGLLRRMTDNATLEYNYRNELSNMSEEQSRRSSSDTTIINGVNVSTRADIFRVRGGELIYKNVSSSGLVNARLWRDNILFANVLLNEQNSGLSLQYDINTSDTNKVILVTNYTNQDFVNLSRSDDTYLVRAAYNYFYTRNIVMDFSIERIKRISTSPSASFDENIISVGIRYQTSGLTF